MLRTAELGHEFSVLGLSFLLGCRTVLREDRFPESNVLLSQQATCGFPPNPYETLITQMGLSGDGGLEFSFLHLLLKAADYRPRSWTYRTPAREVLHRLKDYPGVAYQRIAFLLNDQVEKETR